MEAPQSLLVKHTVGRGLLALRQTGKSSWDLCAIDVRGGKVNWCSPLPRRADIALSVVGDKAIAHDHDGYLFAYDIGTGRPAWNTRLDCEIGEGRLRAVGAETAVGTCAHGEMTTVDSRKVDLLAIDLKTGGVRWRNSPVSDFSRFYLDGDKVVAHEHVPMPTFNFKSFLPKFPSPLWAPRGKGGRASRHLAEVPRTPSRTAALARMSRWRESENALVGSDKSNWTVLDIWTGKPLPHAALVGTARSSTDAGAAEFLAVEPLSSGDDVAFFTQNEDGAKPKQPLYHSDCTRQFSQECFGTPLHPFNQVLRGGRLFEVSCEEIVERDARAEAQGNRWPISGGADFFEPSVLALDVDGQRLTLVLGTRYDLEVGRVVTFEGRKSPLIAKAPGLDPDLVALSEGVLVVQVGPHACALGGNESAIGGQDEALLGYSVVDVDRDAVADVPSDRNQLREIIRGRGGFEPIQCELWTTHVDAQIMPRLKELPRWEEHLASLLRDRDMDIQGAAFAAAAHVRSPGLLRALLRLVEPLPPEDWKTGDRGRAWWADVRERHQATRARAAMVLIEMKHPPAIKPLAAMLLEDPLPDYDHVAGCSAFFQAFCSWTEKSDLPEAKAVIAEYERAMDAPGAWQTLCASQSFLTMIRGRSLWPWDLSDSPY
jgi:hypothetical protein